MIFLKTIIGITILITLLHAPFYNRSMTHGISDVQLKNQATLIDSSLISYYRFHGEFPEQLNTETLHILGLEGIDYTKLSYLSKNPSSYTLNVKLSTTTWTSPNSNITIQKQ